MEDLSMGKVCKRIELRPVKVGLIYGTGEVAKAIARRLVRTPGLEIILFVRPEHPETTVKALEAEFHDWSVGRQDGVGSLVSVTQDETRLKEVNIVINAAGMSLEKAKKNPELAEAIKKQQAAGKNPRAVLLGVNLPIAWEVAKKINQYCCGALILQVSNPMSGIMYFFNRLGWFDMEQIIGLGDIVDILRIQELVARAFPEIAVKNFSLAALGQHGAGIVVPRSSVGLDGLTLEQFAKFAGGNAADNLAKLEKAFAEVADVAYLYLKDTGKTPYESPAAAAGILIETLVNPRKYCALPIVIVAPDDLPYYDIKKGEAVVMQVPVGKGAVLTNQAAELDLSPEEWRSLEKTKTDIRQEFTEADSYLKRLA
ncbi:MAG: hypothetical protein Q8O93_00750 [bacterium]|nr:hypothetical protein [bacterium]